MTPNRAVLTVEIPALAATYRMSADAMDRMILHYLPAAPAELRAKIERLSAMEGGGIDYSGLATVTECLAVLAQYDGYTT